MGLGLIETMKRAGASKVKEIEELIEKTINERNVNNTLKEVLKKYNEFVKERGMWYITRFYPELPKNINEVTYGLGDHEE